MLVLVFPCFFTSAYHAREGFCFPAVTRARASVFRIFPAVTRARAFVFRLSRARGLLFSGCHAREGFCFPAVTRARAFGFRLSRARGLLVSGCHAREGKCLPAVKRHLRTLLRDVRAFWPSAPRAGTRKGSPQASGQAAVPSGRTPCPNKAFPVRTSRHEQPERASCSYFK